MRDALDRYYTPDHVARACVGALAWRPTTLVPEVVLDPHVGGGAFARAARRQWGEHVYVLGSDLDPAAPGYPDTDLWFSGTDFLEGPSSWGTRGIDIIIGNPPYNNAEAHVRRALEVAPYVGFLLRAGFLAGRARGDGLWKEFPPRSVHILSRRPSFTADGRSDSADYVWVQWDRRPHAPKPELEGVRLAWLDVGGAS